MAYKVIILYRLYMPSYFLGTFTEYPYVTAPYTSPPLVLQCFLHFSLPLRYIFIIVFYISHEYLMSFYLSTKINIFHK